MHGRWYLLDGASGLLLAVIAIVGLCSALVSPSYLRTSGRSWTTAARSRSLYYAALFVFWAALLAVPVTGNLAVVWLIVEATTAASALLVAFTGRRRALDAGWKYLVLTTLGLSVALLGIIVLAIGQADAGHHDLHALDWHTLRLAAHTLPKDPTLIAFVLLLVGLAAKIGWAPVHNWLPDAHSEAPAPISALLSAALLPTVLLIAWRVKQTLEPSVGVGTDARRLHRLRIDLDARGDPVSVAVAAVETAAGVFEPRAHGGDRVGYRLRHAARDRRCRDPRCRPRAGQGARLLRRAAVAPDRFRRRPAGADGRRR